MTESLTPRQLEYREYLRSEHWRNQREAALAHRRLDEAVFAAYGWPIDLTNEQILERLLALNLERAGK